MTRTLPIFAAILAVAAIGLASGPTRLPEALESQYRLVSESPNDPKAINDLANLLVLAGRVAQAEAAYQRALMIDPYNSSTRYNLGLLLQQLERHEEAITELTQVVTAEPEHAWGHYQLGVSHEAMKDEAMAIEGYAAAFRLDPRLAFADVNPQVIDSRLLTESMINAYREAPARAVAPLSYNEPDRIADILLPPRPTESVEEAVAETAESAATDDPGMADQLTGAERQRARSLARSQHLRTPPNRVSDPARDSDAPELEEEEDWWDEWPEDGVEQEDFEPRPESTGRLELRLLPQELEEPAPNATATAAR